MEKMKINIGDTVYVEKRIEGKNWNYKFPGREPSQADSEGVNTLCFHGEVIQAGEEVLLVQCAGTNAPAMVNRKFVMMAVPKK